MNGVLKLRRYFMKKNFEKLVSIIVPVYNVEKYLNRCIESITNQT